MLDDLAAVRVGAVDRVEPCRPSCQIGEAFTGLDECCDLVVDLGEMTFHECQRVLAGTTAGVFELEHAGHLGQRQPGGLRFANEADPVGDFGRIVAVARRLCDSGSGSSPIDS